MNRRTFCCILGGAGAAAALGGCSTLMSNPRAFLAVEESLCVGCGACAQVCNGDAITLIRNKAGIDTTKCIRCGKCVKACPYDAIY